MRNECSEPRDLGLKLTPTRLQEESKQEVAAQRVDIRALVIATGIEPPKPLPSSKVEENVRCAVPPVAKQCTARFLKPQCGRVGKKCLSTRNRLGKAREIV